MNASYPRVSPLPLGGTCPGTSVSPILQVIRLSQGQPESGWTLETAWILGRAVAWWTQAELITEPRVWGPPTHVRKTCFLWVEFLKRTVPVDAPTHLFFCNCNGMQVIVPLPLIATTVPLWAGQPGVTLASSVVTDENIPCSPKVQVSLQDVCLEKQNEAMWPQISY